MAQAKLDPVLGELREDDVDILINRLIYNNDGVLIISTDGKLVFK